MTPATQASRLPSRRTRYGAVADHFAHAHRDRGPRADPDPDQTTGNPNAKGTDTQINSLIAPDGGIAPLSIVDPTPVALGSTTLEITKKGARQSNGSVQVLEGAKFYAIAGTRGGTRPTPGIVGSATLNCTTDATGKCQIVVPDRTGGGSNDGTTEGYWVWETAAPTGWGLISQLGLGNYDSAKTVTNYVMFTNKVSGNGTIWEVPKDATAYVGTGPGTTATTAKTAENAFANVRSNPLFPKSCGLKIAIVMDTSTSISTAEMTQLKNAAKGFVGTSALGGTPSQVALYRFSTTASKILDLTSIAANQTAVNAGIDSLPSQGDGYTNWDDAFRKVAFNAQNEKYDAVLMLTDGDPTTRGTAGTATDTNIGFQNVEEGAFSANAVKSMTAPGGGRTKIVGVGIGLATNSYLNLEAISGPVNGEDYFTTDFAGLELKLKEIAVANCGGTVTVIKKTINAAGATISSTAGGWQFTASTVGSYLKEGPGGTLVNSIAKTTAEGSGVNFAVSLDGVNPRTVTVVETAQSGWTPLGVTCTGATPTGNAASFTVPATANTIVSCTVVNQLALTYGTFSVAKTVTGDGKAAAAGKTFSVGYSYPAGAAFPAGSGTLTGLTDGSTVTSGNIPTGAVVTLTEGALPAVPNAAWGSPSFSTNPITIGNGTNVAVTLTNPITLDRGTFSVKKALTGTGAGAVPGTTNFTINWSYPASATYPAANGSFIVKADGVVVPSGVNVPIGAQVTLTEATPPAIAGITWGASPTFSPTSPITIATKNTTVAVTVTNTATLNLGKFSVDKVVTGTGSALVPGTQPFTVHYTYPAGTGYPAGSGDLVVTPDDGAVSSPNLPQGAVVTLTEPTLPPFPGRHVGYSGVQPDHRDDRQRHHCRGHADEPDHPSNGLSRDHEGDRPS